MYDSNAQAIGDKLKAASSAVFSQQTIDSILSLVSTPTDAKVVVDTVTVANNSTLTPAAGTEVVFVTTSDSQVTKLTVNGSTPAVLFQGKGGVDAIFGGPVPNGMSNESAAVANPDAIERVVVGSAGADTITIKDAKNSQVVIGDKDKVVAGSGHTVVVAGQGNSTVVGGADTIVQTAGKESDFTVTLVNGHAKIANATTKVSIDIKGAQYVQLDNKEALIFAETAKQAAVANLYQAVFGRTADAAGLDYWFEQADKGASLKSIAQTFLGSAEYTGAAQTNTQFVDELYHDLLGRDADAAGKHFWVTAMSNGLSRADVVTAFAEVAAINASEVTVVGSVTIVGGDFA